MAILGYLKSTILSKVVMAVTGAILLLFILGHAVGNLQVFMGQEQYNHYAELLQSMEEPLWIMRIGLLVSLVLHILTSINLSLLNKAAKPIGYHVKKYINAKLNSRSMLLTGIMIAAFLTYHLLHFTMGVTNPDDYNHHEFYTDNAYVVDNQACNQSLASADGQTMEVKPVLMKRHDVFQMVVLGFRNPIIAIAYMVFVTLLGFHLSHAIQSCFQTLGVTGPKFTPRMVTCSKVFAVILVLIFISVPLGVLSGLVGGAI